MPRDVRIRTFRSTTEGVRPPTTGADGITAGELATNLADKLLFVGASDGGYLTFRNDVQTVWSVNGKTGDVVSVALTSGPQSFFGLQTFVNGISGPSGFFSGTDNVLEIVASTNGRGIRIAKSNVTTDGDAGVGYIQFGKRSDNEDRNWYMGSVGNREFTFAQGNVGGSPVELLKCNVDGSWRISDAYNLPLTDGTLGQIVYTDGSGNLYFDDPPVGGGGGLTGFILRSGDGLTSPIEADNILTITGGVGIFTIKDGNDTISVRGITATTSTLGVASFAANDFLVSSGAVSLTAGVVRSVNGLTGAVGLPLATTGLSGVASFDSTYFSVSNTGHVSLPAGVPASKTYEVFTARDNHPQANNFATFDTRNSIGVLDFDGTTNESAVFVSIMPEGASYANLQARLRWMTTSAVTGSVLWGAKWEQGTSSLSSDDWSPVTELLHTISGPGNTASGVPYTTTITCTGAFDGITAGDLYRLYVYRGATATTDDIASDVELIAVEVRGV